MLQYAVLPASLTAAFVCLGVFANWAATSRRHWFVRTTGIFVILAPLLVASALELFVTLSITVATVASGTTAYYSITGRSSPTSQTNSSAKFSLTTVMLIVVVIAVAISILNNLPPQNLNAWQTMVSVGVGTGLCLLMPYRGSETRLTWRNQLVLHLVGAGLVAIPLCYLDWLIPVLRGEYDWPPEDGIGLGFFLRGESPFFDWLIVCPGISVATFLMLCLYGASSLESDPTLSTSRLRMRVAVCVLFACVSLTPAYVIYVLLRPPEYLEPQTSDRKNYEHILGIAQTVERSKFANSTANWGTAPRKSLTDVLAGLDRPLEQLRAAVQMPAQVPVAYDGSAEFSIEALSAMRNTARALNAHGRLAILDAKPDQACRIYLDTVRVGVALRDRGLLIDALVGIACSDAGSAEIYKHRQRYSATQSRDAVQKLLTFSGQLESFDQVTVRDRGWVQANMRWYGRLQLALEDLSNEDRYGLLGSARHAFQSEQARIRLLAIELAMNAYRIDHGEVPKNLASLVPEYLPTVPADPFDFNQLPMRYIPTNENYALYSVGPNEIDDGGIAHSIDPESGTVDHDYGDLTLDAAYSDDNIDPNSN